MVSRWIRLFRQYKHVKACCSLTGTFMFVDIEQSALGTTSPNKVKLFRISALRNVILAPRCHFYMSLKSAKRGVSVLLLLATL